MTCPGCISSAVGHDQDCPVMSERAECGDSSENREFFDCRKPRGHKGLHEYALKPWARIRERLAEKHALYQHYRAHARKMSDIEDCHGAWDADINASEVSCAIDELEWCLAVLEGRE
jgi:hypothetical protein